MWPNLCFQTTTLAAVFENELEVKKKRGGGLKGRVASGSSPQRLLQYPKWGKVGLCKATAAEVEIHGEILERLWRQNQCIFGCLHSVLINQLILIDTYINLLIVILILIQICRDSWLSLSNVFLPGESQGWGSLVGCRLWGRTESDTTEAT